MPQRIMPGDSVASRYIELIEDGVIERDPAQEAIVEQLDALNLAIGSMRLASKSSSLGWLFARKQQSNDIVKGLYIYGSVGRGKTMLMDFFFRACPAKRKRRAHFHEFMADVHDRIRAHRAAVKAGTAKGDDPIPPVAEDLAQEAYVLCFDEFAVNDITDAMILSRLFTALFERGVVLVATSNVMPDNLYMDGLNRSLFMPFVDLLQRHVMVVSLDADRDYRLGRLSNTPTYITPLGLKATTKMNAVWAKTTGGMKGEAIALEVMGRDVHVPSATVDAARFSFDDLCRTPLGARDYLAIARRFRTILIDDVPVLRDRERNEAKRFINLIDTLYDSNTRLIVSAAAEPDALYQAASGTEAFEFARTASRLTEMRSDDWLGRAVA
ncbi:MAG: cell division protein ZapE [Pseudomonadota bacterium]